HTTIAALHFLHDQAVLDVGHAGAPISFEAGAEETKLGHGLHQFTREAAGAITLFYDRDEIVFNKLSGGIANKKLFVRKQGIELDEIHAPKFDSWHEGTLSRGAHAPATGWLRGTKEGNKARKERQTGAGEQGKREMATARKHKPRRSQRLRKGQQRKRSSYSQHICTRKEGLLAFTSSWGIGRDRDPRRRDRIQYSR